MIKSINLSHVLTLRKTPSAALDKGRHELGKGGLNYWFCWSQPAHPSRESD